jgi:hypothetical protein
LREQSSGRSKQGVAYEEVIYHDQRYGIILSKRKELGAEARVGRLGKHFAEELVAFVA